MSQLPDLPPICERLEAAPTASSREGREPDATRAAELLDRSLREVGRLPERLCEAVHDPADAEAFFDPWGNPFQYRQPGPGDAPYDLVSYGSDARPGGTGSAADWSMRGDSAGCIAAGAPPVPRSPGIGEGLAVLLDHLTGTYRCLPDAQLVTTGVADRVTIYMLRHKRLPARLCDVFVAEAVPLDPWGNPLQYLVPGPGGALFDIVSAGPDGVVGSGDDTSYQVGEAR